jgi:hypothetical protein
MSVKKSVDMSSNGFLFAPFNVDGQEIPKKANTIIVKGATLEEVSNMLLSKSYIIERLDKDLKTVSTRQAMSKRNKALYVSINIRIKDGSAIITGSCSNNLEIKFGSITISPDDYPIENIGMKCSLFRAAFDELNDFALSFNRPVEYLVK